MDDNDDGNDDGDDDGDDEDNGAVGLLDGVRTNDYVTSCADPMCT